MVSPYLQRPLRTYEEALKARNEREAQGVPPAAGDEDRSGEALAQIAYAEAPVIALDAPDRHPLNIGDVLADDTGFGGTWAHLPVPSAAFVEQPPVAAFTILIEPDQFDLCVGFYQPA